MNFLLYDMAEKLGLTGPLSGTWRGFETLALMLMVWCGFVIAALYPYLKPRLIPLFDTRFRDVIPEHYRLFTRSQYFVRCCQYATWVISPRIFARGLPEVRDLNLATAVDSSTRRLCWIFTIHYVGIFISLVLFLGLQIGHSLGHAS